MIHHCSPTAITGYVAHEHAHAVSDDVAVVRVSHVDGCTLADVAVSWVVWCGCSGAARAGDDARVDGVQRTHLRHQ